MSRFGIRKRLKKLAGGAERPEIVKYSVTYVLPDGSERVIEAEEGYTLLMAADAVGMTISTGRRAGGTCPDGACALCRVEILDPTGLNSLTDPEQQVMDDLAAGTPHEGRARKPGASPTPTSRLGCWTKIRGNGGRVQVLALFDPTSIQGEEEGY